VNPVRPCLKINDVPVGWEYFSQRGWDIFEVPPPVTIGGRFFALFASMLMLLSSVPMSFSSVSFILHFLSLLSTDVLCLWKLRLLGIIVYIY